MPLNYLYFNITIDERSVLFNFSIVDERKPFPYKYIQGLKNGYCIDSLYQLTFKSKQQASSDDFGYSQYT